jgi:hypothetical protein
MASKPSSSISLSEIGTGVAIMSVVGLIDGCVLLDPKRLTVFLSVCRSVCNVHVYI